MTHTAAVFCCCDSRRLRALAREAFALAACESRVIERRPDAPATGAFSMIGNPHVIFRRTHRSLANAALLAAATATLAACGGRDRPSAQLAPSMVTQIGVNSYLWRATLETLSFMPLLQTDSNGGVIVTDWYANPRNPGERVKVTVSILDRDLRADALRVAASRQVAQGGAWVEAPVQAATVQKLEEIILTKARDLRRAAVSG